MRILCDIVEERIVLLGALAQLSLFMEHGPRAKEKNHRNHYNDPEYKYCWYGCTGEGIKFFANALTSW